MRAVRWAGALAASAGAAALGWALVTAPSGDAAAGSAPGEGGRAAAAVRTGIALPGASGTAFPLPAGAAAVRAALEQTGKSPGDVAWLTPPQRVICGKNRNGDYSGRFTFVRIYFEEGGGWGRRRGGEPYWHHDCPYSESNLTSVLGAMTTMTPHIGGNVFSFGDDDLYRYPLAYVSEVGHWEPDAKELDHLREWLLKGGFLVFDDFSGNDQIEQLLRIMAVAMPEARFRQLDRTDAVFRSFFEVDPDSLRLGPSGGGGFGSRNTPIYLGLFEDDDPTKRLMVLAFANNDIGEYMDYNPRGFTVVDMGNEAYKVGVNFIIYALTH